MVHFFPIVRPQRSRNPIRQVAGVDPIPSPYLKRNSAVVLRIDSLSAPHVTRFVYCARYTVYIISSIHFIYDT